MKSSLSWNDVATRMNERVGCVEDAFAWCCGRGDWLDGHEDELSAEAFDQAMRRLKVPELDRRIFWADMDKHNEGVISYEDFAQHFAQTTFLDGERSLPQTPQRRISTATVGSFMSPGYFAPRSGRVSVMSRAVGGIGPHLHLPTGSWERVTTPPSCPPSSGPSGFQLPSQTTSNPTEIGIPHPVAAPRQHDGDTSVRILSNLRPAEGSMCSPGHAMSNGDKLPSLQEATGDLLPSPLTPAQVPLSPDDVENSFRTRVFDMLLRIDERLRRLEIAAGGGRGRSSVRSPPPSMRSPRTSSVK